MCFDLDQKGSQNLPAKKGSKDNNAEEVTAATVEAAAGLAPAEWVTAPEGSKMAWLDAPLPTMGHYK